MLEKPRDFLRENQISPERGLVSEKLMCSPIKITHDKEVGQILLVGDDDNNVSLNQYLPDKTEFLGKSDSKFSYYLERLKSEHLQNPLTIVSRVEFPVDGLDSLEGRLSLLHEMGHAVRGASPDFKGEKLDSYMQHISDDILKEIYASETYASFSNVEDRNLFTLQEFKKHWIVESEKRKDYPEGRLQYEDFLGYVTRLVSEERGAWAQGLRIYHRIKIEEHVDMLEGATAQDIFQVIRSEKALCSYQQDYEIFLNDSEKNDFKGWVKNLLGL